MERELSELKFLFTKLEELKSCGLHGVMVGNFGTLHLAQTVSSLPIQVDFSLNIFNHLALKWLETNKVVKVSASLEASYEDIAAIITSLRQSKNGLTEAHNIQQGIQLEVIVHGALEAMVTEHCLPSQILGGNDKFFCQAHCSEKQYALVDTAGQYHQIKIDQYCRNHIFFAKDLCLLPQLHALAAAGIRNYRIEGRDYSPEHLGLLTKIYRQQLNEIASNHKNFCFDESLIKKVTASSPRELGCGMFRHRLSR